MNISSAFIMLVTNHIYIGALYIMSGFIGGSIGFSLSIMLRLELALPGFMVCSSLQYNSNITFHGLFMMFFMIMPMLIGGFGNMLLPLMLCSSDMMFPRLNALSLWLIFDSLMIMMLSLFIDGGVNAGWTFYVPLSIMNYSAIDFMFFSLHIVGLSSLLGSINFIITLLKSTNLSIINSFLFLPLYCWSMFFTSLLLIISLPVLAGCITMMIFDSHFNCSFFDPLSGGDLLLFQHLFWFFGHPEVYMLILPAFGLISEMISKCSQCIMFGSDSMLIALFIISLLGCMVWGHHMFMVGFDIDTSAYFTFSTCIIAIPTGIKMLNWLTTIYSSCFFIITPLYFIIGFLFSFTFGGFTGMILANSIIDIILHDSYFMIGHSHYVLSLGAVYTIFGSFYTYWMFFSFSLFSDYMGRIHYMIFIISSNFMFFSMHSLGIIGFPSRIYDYYMMFFKFQWFNSFSLMGMYLSMLLFMYLFIVSYLLLVFIIIKYLLMLFFSYLYYLLFINYYLSLLYYMM